MDAFGRRNSRGLGGSTVKVKRTPVLGLGLTSKRTGFTSEEECDGGAPLRRWERARDGLPEVAEGEKEGFEILWIF